MFKKVSIFIILVCFHIFTNTKAQSFSNGSFEANTAGVDQINLSNAAFNGMMSNTAAFGTFGDMDIIKSATYCGLAQNGTWYTALTGSSTDAITMKLLAPLVAGTTYNISFWDKGCWGTYSTSGPPVQLGLALVPGVVGTTIYTAPAPANGIWVNRTFSFVAPNNGQYISVVLTAGGTSDWTQVDNFTFVGALPIELKSFEGECENNEVKLKWSTASEKNNDYFSVERSFNGIDFIKVGTIKGAGNSLTEKNYEFTDNTPSLRKESFGQYSNLNTQISYYRLKQNDIEGSFSYSDIVSVQNCKNKIALEFDVFPNPANDILAVSVNIVSQNCNLIITNSIGEIVIEKNIETSESVIDLSMLSAGIYCVRVISAEGLFTKKLIKN